MSHGIETNQGVHGCAGCAAKDVVDIGRRSFFGALIGMGSMLIGAIVGTPLLRYVLYPVYAKGNGGSWSDVGNVSELDLSEGPVSKTITFTQQDGWREVVCTESVYVCRAGDGQLQVLSAICPHLGCSVAWQASQGKFVCPCHGGQFKPDGQHIAGPPPRSLDSLKAQVKDGKLQVQFEYFQTNQPHQESLS